MQLAQKLGIRKGMRLLVHGAPEGYYDLLAPLPEGAEIVSEGLGEIAFMQLFLHNLPDLESLTAETLAGCGGRSLLWLTYPKVSSGSASGLSRDLIRETLQKVGWRAVTIVAVDNTWTALRFRPVET